MNFFSFFPLWSEQNEPKHDSSSSPGMTDQEKEIAASAYEVFLVNHLHSFLSLHAVTLKLPWQQGLTDDYSLIVSVSESNLSTVTIRVQQLGYIGPKQEKKQHVHVGNIKLSDRRESDGYTHNEIATYHLCFRTFGGHVCISKTG